MGDLVGLATAVASYIIIIGAIGFFTVKAVTWGLASVFTLWMGAPLVDSFTRQELLADLLPHFERLLLFYPEVVVPTSFDSFAQVGGLLGSGLAVLFIVLGVIPYSIGVLLGLTKWPELLLLRLVI